MGLTYIPPRQNTMQNQLMSMLTNLMFQKISHKNQMEIVDKQLKAGEILSKNKIEAEKLKLEEKRAYQEGQAKKEKESEYASKGQKVLDPTMGQPSKQSGAPDDVFYDSVLGKYVTRKPKFEVGSLKEFDVGDKKITGIYTGKNTDNFGGMLGWAKTNIEAPRYKPGTNVNVTANIGQKGMTKVVEKMGEELVTQRTDVVGSANALKNIYEAEDLLNSGMITGTGAKFLTGVGNFLASRLGFKRYEDPVQNTQAYARIVGAQVAQIIKQFGAGTGLSDADREYAEGIVGGDITLNEKSIRKIIEINKRGHENLIKNYNNKVSQLKKKPGAENLLYDLSVEMPKKQKPPGNAPKTAIDYLKQNPQFADQFKQKYGYLPEGF